MPAGAAGPARRESQPRGGSRGPYFPPGLCVQRSDRPVGDAVLRGTGTDFLSSLGGPAGAIAPCQVGPGA